MSIVVQRINIYLDRHHRVRPSLAALVLVTLMIQVSPPIDAISIETAGGASRGVSEIRTIKFSGYEWRVKSSHGNRVGPGPNYFADNDNVSIDDRGRLHLRITQLEGKWHCAEIISTKSFGYGRYSFQVEGDVANLDPRVVLGLFTWSDSPAYAHREIDVEISRWGNEKTLNAQYVIQPYDRAGNITRFEIPGGLETTTHTFSWLQNSVRFHSTGLAKRGSRARKLTIQDHLFERNIPKAGGENARINLWLVDGKPPSSLSHVEVVLSRFMFTPLR